MTIHPMKVVSIVDENDGDDYRQLSFDFGKEDIRNNRDKQPIKMQSRIEAEKCIISEEEEDEDAEEIIEGFIIDLCGLC